MAGLLDILRIELENLDNEKIDECLLADIEPSDHDVGEISVELRKYFILSRQFTHGAARMFLEVQLAQNQQTQEEAASKCLELETKAKLLREIFWISLKDEHRLWNKESIGIRRGWRVVWNSPSEESGRRSLWQRLFGG